MADGRALLPSSEVHGTGIPAGHPGCEHSGPGQAVSGPARRTPANLCESWFRKNGALPRADWHEAKLGIMRQADLAKFTQHPDLAELLLATGDVELVEDSPSEPYWGIGPDGQGLNWAGRILMEVRQKLQVMGDRF